VELEDAMRTQHACRYYRDEPVPDEVLLRAVEQARFAPNGGNRCAVRYGTRFTAADRREPSSPAPDLPARRAPPRHGRG
jgi:nitroreductase